MLTTVIQTFTIQNAITHIINSIVNETDTHSLCGVSLQNETFWSIHGFPSYQSDCTVPRSDFVAHLLVGVNLGCGIFVVSGNCIHQFLDAFYDVHDYAIHRAELKKMIVVLDSDDLVVPLLSDDVILESLPHTLIVVPRDDLIDLWTVDLSFNRELNPSNKFWFETWSFDHEIVLPTITDLKGLTLRVAGINYRPYTAYFRTSEGQGNAHLHGSNESFGLYIDGYEFTLCLEFCRHFNCVLEITLEEEEFWGEIFENHTGTGMVGDMVDRSADVTVGAIYRWRSVFEFTTYSKIMQQAKILMLVPRPHLLPYYETPILPFPPLIWFCLFGSYAINAAVLYLFEFVQLKIHSLKTRQERNRKGLSYSILTTFRSIVFEGTQFDPTLLSEFVLFGLFLYYSLIVGNVYSGGLASVMTIPRYEGLLDTIHKLVHSNIEWGGLAADYLFSILHTEKPLLQEFINGYTVYSLEDCYAHAKALDMALVVETMQYGNLAFNDYIDLEVSENLMPMAESIYNEQTLVVSRKTWPFMYLMDEVILNVQKGGIGQFLEYNATLHTMDIRMQKNLHREIDKDAAIIPLEVEHILGAIFLLVCGHLLAFLTFLLELAVAKRKNRSKVTMPLKPKQQKRRVRNR